MKKNILVLIAIAGIGLAFMAGTLVNRRQSAPTSAPAAKVAVYTCPMHPAYTSDHAGTCPMCGMALVLAGIHDGTSSPGAAVAETPGGPKVDSDKQQLIGVRIEEVPPVSASHLTLRVPGRISVDEQR